MRIFRIIPILAIACLAFAPSTQAMTKLYTEYIVSTNGTILYTGETGRGASVGIAYGLELEFRYQDSFGGRDYYNNYLNYCVTNNMGGGDVYYALVSELKDDSSIDSSDVKSVTTYARCIGETGRIAYVYSTRDSAQRKGLLNGSQLTENNVAIFRTGGGLDGLVLSNKLDVAVTSFEGYENIIPPVGVQQCRIDYECTLTYDANGGTGTMVGQVVTNNGVLAVNEFSKPGYSFNGWLYKGKTYSAGSVLSNLTDDATISATWLENTYSVTLMSQGVAVTNVMATYHKTLPAVSRPEREGYAFNGYFAEVDSSGNGTGSQYYNAGGKGLIEYDIVGDAMFYAQWTPNSYVITFNANGGSPTTTSYTKEYGAELAAPAVSREGYTFAGWSPSVPSTVPAGDATYTAQWQVNTYAIVFDANDGSVATTNLLDYGETLSAPTVSREGYTFSRWLPSVPSTVPANDATYTAQWTTNQYKIAFDANGGSGSQNKWLYYGEPLSAPDVSWVGHTFTGWDPAVPPTVPAGDTTYTAQWQVNTYAIVFDANDGSVATTNLLDYGETLSAPTVSREGYTFSRWLPSVPSTVPANDATYTAQWTTNQYKIAFDANGGSGSQNKWLYYGEPLSAPDVSWVGHTFTGWDPAVPSTVPAGDATYTAQWTTNKHTIIFDANKGVGGTTNLLDYGTAIIPPEVSRPGYNFTKWKPALYDGATVPDNDVTYVAQWDEHRVEVLFIGGTGATPINQKVTYRADETYGFFGGLPTVEKSGSLFVGWRDEDDNLVTNDTIVDPEVKTLWACWIDDPSFSITFVDICGSETNNIENVVYTNGVEYASLPIMTREGYDFAGWWTTEEATNRVQQVATNIANKTITKLYARWKLSATNVTVTASGTNYLVSWGSEFSDVVGSIAKPTLLDSTKSFSFAWWCCDGKPVQDDFIVTNSMTLTPQFTIKEFSDIVRIPELAFDTDLNSLWCASNSTKELHSGTLEGGSDYKTRLIAYLKSPGSIIFDYDATLLIKGNNTKQTKAYFRFYMDTLNQKPDFYRAIAGAVKTNGTDSITATSNVCWQVERNWTDSSGNQVILSNIKYQPEMPAWTNEWSSTNSPSLKLVTESGPGVLTFKYRVSGETGYVATNGAPVLCDYLKFSELGGGETLRLEGFMATNEFVEVAITNTADQAHTFVWRYVKDYDVKAGDDAAWVTDIVWTPLASTSSSIEYEYTKPDGTVAKKSLSVPNDWVDQYGLMDITSATDYLSALTNSSGKIGFDGSSLPYWADYIAGTDPTNAASVFSVTNFTISADGSISIEWSPNLTDRAYTIFGKTNLLDAVWTSPTNSAHRFFRVEVSLP